MRPAAIALALALGACVPHFREDADRARRAMDAGAMQELLDAASAAAAAGDHEGAAERYLEAIDANPRFPASVYLALARELVDAGEPARALAVTRWVVAERSAELGALGGSSGPLAGVAARFAAADLPALAIEVLALSGGGAVDPGLVARIPELDQHLGKLLRAREHAAAGRPEEAVDAYWQWVAEYGVPDHAVLRSWARDACALLQVNELMRRAAERAAAEGDFVRAAREHGLALVYAPGGAGPPDAGPFVEASRRAGDLLRLGPEAARRVDEATRAAEADRLGPAIHATRRAVLDAPWHPALRQNLATLLLAAGLDDEAARQTEWQRALALR